MNKVEDLYSIAEQFVGAGNVADVREFGHGNINDTFLVTADAGADGHWILQRINTNVFRRPEAVMQNISIATGHMRMRVEGMALPGRRRWEVPQVLQTRDGRDHLVRPDGSFWRGLSFLENCRSFDTIVDGRHAGEVGYAVGLFHSLLSDLAPDKLIDTLPGFHITPDYLQHYREVLVTRPASGSAEERYCAEFIRGRSPWAGILEEAKKEGRLRIRPVHGDPKINNIMIDDVTGQAVGIVDLDTVKPGLVHYDIGDCLRSACNPLGEETEEWERVHFDIDTCRAFFHGYLSETRRFLTGDDFSCLYDAVRLIAFELGLRFFTDYLEGNVYFKARGPHHNLVRALVQFRLAASIESQEPAIRRMMGEMQ